MGFANIGSTWHCRAVCKGFSGLGMDGMDLSPDKISISFTVARPKNTK